jgi:Uma2 family endonuclease
MSQIVHGTSPAKRPDRYSYREYRSWPDNERWELIHGAAFDMSPAPRRVHQSFVIRVASQLDRHFLGTECRPYVAPVDVFLPEADEPLDEIRTVVQPDVFVVCDSGRLIDEGVRGAPEFVVEVLSPGTAMKDQSEKRKLYAEHGVGEYWIINPDTFEVFVYFLRADQTYGLPTVADLRDGVPSTRFPELILRVSPEDL